MAIKNEIILAALEEFKKDRDGDKVISALTKTTVDEYCRNFLVVYGSLRKGEYNFKRVISKYGKNSFAYIRSHDITFAELYDLGDYPAIIRGIWGDVVVGDIMYCSDEVFSMIEEMELNSGYRHATTRVYDPTLGSIKVCVLPYYEAEPGLRNRIASQSALYPRVKSGDWSVYLKNVIKA